MSVYIEISKIKTTISEIPNGATGVHESTLRSYHILEKVKDLLRINAPSEVILELIEIMEVRNE